MKLSAALQHITLEVIHVNLDKSAVTGKDLHPGVVITPHIDARRPWITQVSKAKDGVGKRVPVRYTPLHTLLARHIGTQRNDVVDAAFPLLGCSHLYFFRALPKRVIDILDEFAKRQSQSGTGTGRQSVGLWELLDLLQSHYGWTVSMLVELVTAVELIVEEGVEVQLAAAAEGRKRANDRKIEQGKDVSGFVTAYHSQRLQ